MRASRRAAAALTALLAAGPAAVPASACVSVGVYQDNPASTMPALQHTMGPGITVISTYLTAGRPIAAGLIAAANHDDAALMVTWDPDGGSDGPTQPAYRLSRVVAGRYDASLKALVAQLRTVRHGAILRPMPEMNTPWYAWSGLVNGNTPAEYIAAWDRVRRVVRAARGGTRIRMLWAPYAESIPSTTANAYGAYFPGIAEVDLVGASGYNFGATSSGLQWTEPGALFTSAYQAIETLAPKPFWFAETASTSTGGDQAGWIGTLATLQASAMPNLAGFVWYDVADPTGDFRLQTMPAIQAFKTLLQEEACR